VTAQLLQKVLEFDTIAAANLPFDTTKMETILASSNADKEDTNEMMIIQQHDTVVNDCVKKDICSVTCSVSTPQSEAVPSANQAQPENTIVSAAEPMVLQLK
jgi:hypothetical protein